MMGLKRWFAEKWTAQDGSECGDYDGKGYPKCRPTKRVSSETPKTWSELSPSEKDRAIADKQKSREEVSKVRFKKTKKHLGDK
jgi:hypothetical protein